MRIGIIRWAAAAAVMLFGGSAVASQALDHLFGRVDPVRAIELGARGADTYGRAAQALFEQSADPALRARAEDYARIALVRDPTTMRAWSALATLRGAEGDPAGAEAILVALGPLAQRELPAQLFLIDRAVRGGDIERALRHYDIALRTSNSSDDLLLPVLVQATREPLVAEPLATLLRRRPNWEKPFLVRLAESAPDDRVLAGLLQNTYAADRAGHEAPLMNIARRMAGEGHAAAAWRVFRTVDPEGAQKRLRYPSFEKMGPWPPFYWSLPSEGPVSSTIRTREGTLDIRVATDASGEAARQMMALPAGTYRLTADTSAVPGENPARLEASIVCADGSGQLVNASLPQERPVFRTTGACPYQILLVRASGTPQAGSSAIVLEHIAIAPQGQPPAE